MTNTNHNAWTLTVHTAKFLNKKAGQLDAKLYGHTVVPDKPTPTPTNWNDVVLIGSVLLFFAVLVYFIPNLRKN